MYRRAVMSDVAAIASIHFRELSSDFLPSLGEPFLRSLYADLLSTKGIYAWVIGHGDKVEGLIVGSANFSKAFKNIITQNFISYSLLVFPLIIKKPIVLKLILETLFYTKKTGRNISTAELVVIAISKKEQGKGHGRRLISLLEEKFKKLGINKYKVSVNANNKTANLFYKAMGFKMSRPFFLYGRKINIYSKSIK